MKVVSVIGKHGMAVIIGRGANFILPPNERLSIRIVAPMDLRVLNFSRLLNISEEEARKRVIVKEAKRRAFVRKSFNADIAELQKHKHVITLNGHTGLACNANAKYASELGHKLAAESGTFGAIYCYDGQTKLWFYSLRSIDNFDVSEIAKAYGGGGHPRASGFSIKQLLMD